MLMGAVYLAYSAYYVSINMHGVKNFINLLLNGIYVFLFLMIFNNTIKVIRILKAHSNLLVGIEGILIQESLVMKIRMMKRFLFIIIAYFSYEVLFNGLFAWLKEEN